MTYRNKHDSSGKCGEIGEKVEKLFVSVLKRKDPKARVGTSQEDLFGKIDVVSPKYGGTYDVKAKKKVSRSNAEAQDEFIWIEYQNVQGTRGWLFGDADFIAFERENDFVVIPRNDLIKVCKLLVDKDRFVVEGKYALYKMYQRKGRKDLLTMIKMSDIVGLSNVEIMEK